MNCWSQERCECSSLRLSGDQQLHKWQNGGRGREAAEADVSAERGLWILHWIQVKVEGSSFHLPVDRQPMHDLQIADRLVQADSLERPLPAHCAEHRLGQVQPSGLIQGQLLDVSASHCEMVAAASLRDDRNCIRGNGDKEREREKCQQCR